MDPNDQQITIDLTGSNGLAPHFYADQPESVPTPNLRYQAAPGMTVAGTYDPFRQAGYMSPSNTGTKDIEITSNPWSTDVTAWEYDAINQNVYLATGNITTFGSVSTTTFFGADMAFIGWQTPSVIDMAIYQVNGKRTLMCMGIDTTAGEGRIATKDLDHGGGITMNYLGTSGAVSGTFGLSTAPTKLIPADNNYCYILDNNAVHKLDGTLAGGTTGTVTANVLTFPAWFALTDGLDLHGKLYIGVQNTPSPSSGSAGNYAGFCGVYIWDRSSTTFGFQDFAIIPQGHFIRKMYVSAEGQIRCIISTASNETQIVEYNGVSFQTIARLGVLSFPRYYDAAVVVDTGIWWQGFDAKIWFYGDVTPETSGNAVGVAGTPVNDQESLYNIGNIAPAGAIGSTLFYASSLSDYSSGTPTGMRTSPEGFYVAYQDVFRSTFFVKKWYPHAQASSSLIATMPSDAGNIFYPVTPLPVYSCVQFIKIACSPTTDDGAGNTTVVATVNVYYNMSTTASASISVTRNMCLSGMVDIPCAKDGVFTVQLGIVYNTAQSVGPYDFHPYMAVVNYYQAKKRK